jgi:hypothetical protein
MMKKLNDKQDKNPFKIPEKYFEEVNRKIISSTSGYIQKTERKGFYSRFRSHLLIAASVTGLIILGYSVVKLISSDKLNSTLSDIKNNESIELYINDIDMLTLEENAALMVLSEEEADVNKSDIINYLLLENIEVDEIYELL